jgi:hypothetical protein
MIIKQGFVSPTIGGFNFLELYNLRKYDNPNEPMVLFGCYGQDEYNIINNHKSQLILRWCGVDSYIVNKHNLNFFNKENIIHITPLLKVHQFLNEMGIKCHLIKIIADELPKPTKLGDKVYAYLSKTKPDYYGAPIVNLLKNKYDILVGDFSISQNDWRNGVGDTFYSQAFIGLALSQYAGGGAGINEMGLRGIKVVTNVVNLPNTIKWNTIEDIENAIDKEKENIDKINVELANMVYNSMVSDMKHYDLDKLIIK